MTKLLNRPLVLAMLSVGNLGAAFVTQILMFSIVGISIDTDIFILASTLPILVSSVISGILNNILVPVFASQKETKSASLEDFLSVVTLASIVLFVVLFCVKPLVVYLFGERYSDSNITLFQSIYTFQLLGMSLNIIYAVIWSYLNAQGRHFVSEFIPFILSVTSIPILYLLLPKFGVITMAILVPTKAFLIILMQVKYVEIRSSLAIKKEVAVKLWGKLKPIVLSSIYYKSDTLIERYLLSSVNAGILSLYNLAQQLINASLQVVTKSICTPNIKLLGSLKAGDDVKYSSFFYKTIKSMSLLIVFLVLVIVFNDSLFYWFFYLSETLKNEYREIWLYFMLLSGILIANSLSVFVNSSFYIHGDTKTPSKVSVIVFTVFIPIKVLSFYWYGVEGIAVSASVNAILNLFILLLIHNRALIHGKCKNVN